jgi:acetyl-CoA C-acetyltransferase
VRTAGGRRNGKLAAWHPADLAGEVLNAVIERSKIDPATVEDVILGCVTQAGEQSFAFARNAVLASNLPETVPAVTIDRPLRRLCPGRKISLRLDSAAKNFHDVDVIQ